MVIHFHRRPGGRQLAYAAIASRLLSPSAFGLMALANLVVLFLQFFTRLGLASALVQSPDLTEEDIRAASTAGAILGMVFFALVWRLTPWISEIFHEPELQAFLGFWPFPFPSPDGR